MATDWNAILTLLLGSGAIVSLATLLYNWRQSVIQRQIEDKREAAQRDFESRQFAKEYYMKIYGHIAILAELAEGYNRSLKAGETDVFSFKDCKFAKLNSQEILNDFNEAYENFSSYYIKQICDGYEIFISKKLKELLSKFWHLAKTFHDKNEDLKVIKQVTFFKNVADETTNYMEKLFGLQEVRQNV